MKFIAFLWIYGMACVEMDEFYISQQVHDEMHANRRHVGDGLGRCMYLEFMFVCILSEIKRHGQIHN